MHPASLLSTFLPLLNLTTAHPTIRNNQTTITILLQTTSLLSPSPPVTIALLIPLYQLTPCSLSRSPCSASKISIPPQSLSLSPLPLRPSVFSLSIDAIECRAYKDTAGLEPGSAPFSIRSPALLSTNLVVVGAVLCYVVETET